MLICVFRMKFYCEICVDSISVHTERVHSVSYSYSLLLSSIYLYVSFFEKFTTPIQILGGR